MRICASDLNLFVVTGIWSASLPSTSSMQLWKMSFTLSTDATGDGSDTGVSVNSTAKFLRGKSLDFLKFSSILEPLVPLMFSEPTDVKLWVI